jgi:hypothetical protein
MRVYRFVPLAVLIGGLLAGAPVQPVPKRPAAAKPAAKRAATASKSVPKSVAKAGPRTGAAKPAIRRAPAVATSGTANRTRTTATAARRSARTPVRRAPVYRAQMAPTADRYKEIQQALADKGYFQGEVDGAWGATSADALKRFQKDQKLADSGKLDSLSLIALGLGPKRNLTSRSTTETRPKDDSRRPEGSERP